MTQKKMNGIMNMRDPIIPLPPPTSARKWKNSKFQQATADSNPAGAREIKQMI